ncbi:MAG: ferrous iron transport protein A [Kiritimatiellae bacterium]|nr:ferrous iron transport protein A [Kiritimatiellia bacterium]
MSLSAVKAGRKVRILKVAGEEGTKKRLNTLGFVAGIVITVVHVSTGNMIVAIHDSRIAINSEVSDNVLVEEV